VGTAVVEEVEHQRRLGVIARTLAPETPAEAAFRRGLDQLRLERRNSYTATAERREETRTVSDRLIGSEDGI